MKKTLSLLLLALITLSCFDNIDRNCVDHHKGTYKSTIKIDDKVYESVFTRDSKIQVETYKEKVDSASVRWVNDCEVIFTTINPKNMVEKKDIHLKILTTTDSTYTFEYSYIGDVNKQKGVAKKLK